MIKTEQYIPESGDDKGKVFIISRFSAFSGDRFARRLIKALAEAGSKLPPESINLGMSALSGFSMALFGQMNDEKADMFFEELLGQCQIKRSYNLEPAKIIEPDIQDPQTLIDLRTRAFLINVDFLKAAAFQFFPLV